MSTAHKGYIEIEKYKQLESDYLCLKEELAQLKRMIFGVKSERFVPDGPDAVQMRLNFTDLLMPEFEQLEESTEVTEIVTRTKPAKKKPVREGLPEHLRREQKIFEPENIPEGAVKIGEKITEVLEYKPGEVYVIQIVRPKYALPDQAGVINAELPTLPIPKGNAGPGLLAHFIISKFVDHLPFYRLNKILKREGVTIPESTINDWFRMSCDLISPLYHTLKEHLLKSDYIQGDETPLPVLTSDKKGAAHKGYHWVYYDPLKKIVIFDYQKTRGREGPDVFLENFKGSLQTDGYAGYEHFKDNSNIVLLSCMAHARRYFEKSLGSYKELSEFALAKIQKLYRIEREAKEGNLTHEQIKNERQTKAVPILNSLENWLIEKQEAVLPKSSIGKAINYTIKLWPRLKQYLNDGKYQIDNNLIENQIRTVALGRKNYLFAGSHEAAQRAAMVYSLLGTCKLHNVNPREWLTYVLTVISDYKANRLDKLFPQNFLALQQK